MENSKEGILDEELDNSIDQPWPIAAKYGVIGGAVFVFLELIKYSLGMMDVDRMIDPGANFTVKSMVTGVILPPLSWLVYFGLYFFAIKNHREELGGFISFGKAYKVSFFSVLVKAVIVFVWGMILYFILIPDYSQDMINFLNDTLSQNVGGSNNIVEMYSMIYNPFVLTLLAVLSTIAGGAFLSIFAAAVGKKSAINN